MKLRRYGKARSTAGKNDDKIVTPRLRKWRCVDAITIGVVAKVEVG